MSSFGLPNSNYAQSQVTTTPETNHMQVENGGLFTRDECRNLARYSQPQIEKSSKPMMGTTTAFARASRSLSGW